MGSMGVLYSVSSGFEILRLSGAISSEHRKLESVLYAADKIDGASSLRPSIKRGVLSCPRGLLRIVCLFLQQGNLMLLFLSKTFLILPLHIM